MRCKEVCIVLTETEIKSLLIGGEIVHKVKHPDLQPENICIINKKYIGKH